MLHSSKTIGKQGGTKVRKQPFETFQPGVKPQFIPIERPSQKPVDQQQFQEVVLQELLKMSPQQKDEYHERLQNEMHRVYTNKFGQNYTKESAVRVFNDERKQILNMLQKANATMQAELMQDSPVPNKEMHLRKAMQTKEKLLRKMELEKFHPGDMNSADMLEYMPILNEMTTHLFDAYGTTDQLKEEYAPEPTNSVEDFIDEIIDNLPPAAEIIIDDDMDYLEELDQLHPRGTTPDYLGRQERKASIQLEQQCENYLICKAFPLLVEQEPGKLYPMQTPDIKDIVYVTAGEYDRRQILNRIRSKLRGLKEHITRNSSLRVSGFRTKDRPSYTMFGQLKADLAAMSEQDRFKNISSVANFQDYCTRLGIPNVEDKELVRLDLIDAFPALTGMQTPVNVTAIPQSKTKGVRIFNVLRAWSGFDKMSELFNSAGQGTVVKTVRSKLKIPDKLPSSVSAFLSYFAAIVIALGVLTVLFTFLFSGGTQTPQRSSVPTPVPQPTPVVPGLDDYNSYKGMSNEVLKRIIPDLTNLNSTLSDVQRSAFSEVSRVFNVSNEFSTTVNLARVSIEQMSATDVIDFVKGDIKRRLFHHALAQDQPAFGKVKESFTLIDFSYPTQQTVTKIWNIWQAYTDKSQKRANPLDREIFIQTVEEEIDQLFEEHYTDVEAIRKMLIKSEKSIYQARVLAGEDIDNTISVLRTFNDEFTQISSSVKKTLENMVDIVTLNEKLPEYPLKKDLRTTEKRIYVEHMKLITERYPEYDNETAIDMYAPTVLGSNYLKIFDMLNNADDMASTRAHFRHYGYYQTENQSLSQNEYEIYTIAEEIRKITLADPSRARSVWIETHLAVINGLARQFGKKLSAVESINALLLTLIGASTLSAATFQFLSLFGYRFGEISRWVKASQKCWFVYVIYTLSSLAMFYYEYESPIATVLSTLAMPLGLLLGLGLSATEVAAGMMNRRPGNIIYPLLGGFDPDIENTKTWATAIQESTDVFATIIDPFTTASISYWGLLTSAAATTAAAWFAPAIAIGGVATTAAFTLFGTYTRFQASQIDLKVKMAKTIFNVLVFDFPPLWKLLTYLFPDEELSRDANNQPVLSDVSNDREMKRIRTLSMITAVVVALYSTYLSPENILSAQKEQIYGLLRTSVVDGSTEVTLSDRITSLQINLSVLKNYVDHEGEFKKRFSVATTFYEDIYATKSYFSEILDNLSEARKTFSSNPAQSLESFKTKERALRQILPRETISLYPAKIKGSWTTVEYRSGDYYLRNVKVSSKDVEEFGTPFKFSSEKTYTQIGLEEELESGEKVVCVRSENTQDWIWVPSYFFRDVNHSFRTTELEYATAEFAYPVAYKTNYFEAGERAFVQKFVETGGETVWRVIQPDGGLGMEIPPGDVIFSPITTIAPQETGKRFMKLSEGSKIYTAGVVFPTENGNLYQLFQDLNPPAVVYARREDLFEVPEGSFKIKITGKVWEYTFDLKTEKYNFKLFPPSESSLLNSPKYGPGHVFTVEKVTEEGFRIGTTIRNGVLVEQILKFDSFDYFKILDEEPQLQPLVSSRCVTNKNRPQRK